MGARRRAAVRRVRSDMGGMGVHVVLAIFIIAAVGAMYWLARGNAEDAEDAQVDADAATERAETVESQADAALSRVLRDCGRRDAYARALRKRGMCAVARETVEQIDAPDPDDPDPDDPEVQEPEIQNPERQDPEVQNPETQDPEIADGETDDPDPDDPESQDPEVDDPEPDDPDPATPFEFTFRIVFPEGLLREERSYLVTCDSGTGECVVVDEQASQ